MSENSNNEQAFETMMFAAFLHGREDGGRPFTQWFTENLYKDQFNSLVQSAQKEIEALKAERDKLLKFKEYVHDRLDKAGVPHDPDPENNKSHGCRIEGRLNYVEAQTSHFKSICELGEKVIDHRERKPRQESLQEEWHSKGLELREQYAELKKKQI